MREDKDVVDSVSLAASKAPPYVPNADLKLFEVIPRRELEQPGGHVEQALRPLAALDAAMLHETPQFLFSGRGT